MLIKSSMESEELAYDTANIVYKNVGPTYNGWWMKEGYGQGYSWVMAEHNDYSVRLFFEFMDTGFCYVKVHFTNGAAYEDLVAYSWNYAKESPEYPFEGTQNRVRDFLDNFFEAGGGMDMLREKYEKGNNLYDVDSYIQNSRKSSRRPVKSSANNLPSEVYYVVVNGSRQYYEDYDEADDNLETLRAIGKGKVDGVYTETDPDEIYELYEVGYIGNSRRPVKSSFIVGKQDSGTKVYFCEDGKYYSENDYSRPSIKIFNNKSEADKIAKRSKSGFVSPLEK